MRGRGTESEDAIVTRLENAQKEIDAKDEKGLFDCVIVNDDLETAYGQLKEVLSEDMKAAAESQK